MSRFIESDPRQPMLLPVDLREWVPDDDLAHFVLEAVERVAMSRFHVNTHGGGSAQYHPQMMLALLVYSYANGVFGSRRIERATYRDLGTRFLCADVHPDHDTICKFRRENLEAIAEAFEQVLLLARELKLLRVGIVSVDGTRMDANARKHRSVRYDRAKALREQLQADIAELLATAESEDLSEEDAQALPAELARREALKAQLDAACERLEQEAQVQAAREREAYEAKMAARERGEVRRSGRPPKPPGDGTPAEDAQTNLTDPDSRLMRKSPKHEYRQAYNAQAVVDAAGSQLVLGARVTQSSNDANELVAGMDAVPASLGAPGLVLADRGYVNGREVGELKRRGMEVLMATGAEPTRRRYEFRPPPSKPRREFSTCAAWIAAMRAVMDSDIGRALYARRKHTVEPVFGIVREAMGFRRFLLRGIEKVSGEWTLVSLAYNCRRVHRLVQLQAA